jgi:hypothetical protein
VQVSALRLALLTGAATAASFGLFYLWLRSPLALALLGAALFGTVFMMVGASLGDDPLAADEAWRLEAGDLAGDHAGDLGGGLLGGDPSGGGPEDGPDELLPAADRERPPGVAAMAPAGPPLDRPDAGPQPDRTA